MNRIKHLREKRQVTQSALRKELGWTQPRIANYESGIRTPGLSESREIVAALNALGVECTLDQVFPVEESAQSVA
ncbi:MAG: transcriptional regulator [Sphingopyxis sp.]|nr:MAG: transcriptional regulator [Sphingopyxis sp.]